MGHANPLVSVVIPTYNAAQYIAEAVDSALNQTYRRLEVIIVDDGSVDNTRELLAQRYGEKIRYIWQSNAGVAAARNTGIRAAQGQYVAFLDADDVFHPRRLELQVPIAEVDPRLGIVASRYTNVSEWTPLPDGEIERIWITLDDLVVQGRFGSCGVLARKECFEVVGYFDESLKTAEDREMWMRIAVRYRVVRLEIPLFWYRVTPGSLTRSTSDRECVERMEQSFRIVIDKIFRLPELAGQWCLRRKAFAWADVASCYMYREANCPLQALARITRSLLWWPLPDSTTDPWVRSVRCSRFRVFAVTLLMVLTSKGRAQSV